MHKNASGGYGRLMRDYRQVGQPSGGYDLNFLLAQVPCPGAYVEEHPKKNSLRTLTMS